MAVAVQPTMEVAMKKKLPTKQKRVVVTGMGLETPIGHDPDVFYNNLLEGVSGISEIEAFDCSHYPTVCLLHDLSAFLESVLGLDLIGGFLITENCWGDQVFLDRWMGCTKTFKEDGQFHALHANSWQESIGRWWNY